MKVTKKNIELKDGLNKEWVITNGIGGFCSSTILGANTRRYHGLLIAPLIPPAQRHLLISKVDENISVNGEDYKLYTNICKNHISDGYKNLDSFEKEVLPIFTYKVKDIKIVKTISMVQGRNTVVISYKIKNGKNEAKLTLAPIIHFRDFHQMTPNHDFSLRQKIDKNKVRIEVDGNASTPMYIYVNDGEYFEHKNDKFKNMYYLKEEERGFPAEEDLAVPGRYEVIINPKELKEITFVASLEDNTEQIDANKLFEEETKRVEQIIKDSDLLIKKTRYTKADKEYNELVKKLLIAADSFVINRPSFGTHSLIAGFPWFLDWGRDAFISFEGLILIPKRFDLAKELLLTFTRDIKYGLVPNGYSGFDNRPLYNSADASLLLFEQVNKYLQYTKDYDFIKENIYEKLKDIIDNYTNGIDLDNNIFIAEDGLLSSGTESTQNTWMDVKIGNFAVTPRNGKVVELNALWYNALKTLENLANRFGEKEIADKYKKISTKHKKEFELKFFNKKKKSLYDVIGDDKIRPNQLFSISTTYPVIKPSSEIGKTIFKTVQTKLLTKYGLRTLAKGEEGYIPYYEGSPEQRDKSYHQGIVWVWLIGLYSDAFKNIIDDEKDRLEKEKLKIEYEKFIKSVYTTFKAEIDDSEGIGTISEVYSSQAPFKTGGTFSQAWSVSEILKIVTKLK